MTLAEDLERATKRAKANATPDRDLPCMDCGVASLCAGIAWELARTFNHQLHKRGEKQLGRGEIVRCRECSNRWQRECEEEDSRRHWQGVAVREAREGIKVGEDAPPSTEKQHDLF